VLIKTKNNFTGILEIIIKEKLFGGDI